MYERYFDDVLKQLPMTTVLFTPARQLRGWLNNDKWWWQRWSVPQFYYLMVEMEDAGLVEWAYCKVVIDGVPVRHRMYRRFDGRGVSSEVLRGV